MNQKSTTAEFIKKARLIHGDKYAYARAVYLGTFRKITITCPEHGDFSQTPSGHLGGNGCRKCGDSLRGSSQRKAAAEEFVAKARSVHGGKYVYARALYVDAKSKVTITCPQHGDFRQKPNHHLAGVGCPKCGGSSPSTTEEFIQKARRVHGDKYTYADVQYLNAFSKVTITCPIQGHGNFMQTPDNHAHGYGCPRCGHNARPSMEEFIQKAKQVHGDKYTYPYAGYVNARSTITITCPVQGHGSFRQVPDKHLNGHGCPKCCQSHGERAVLQILSESLRNTGLEFAPQFRIQECRYKRPLPFDFAVTRQNVVVGLIEYHGQQHYGAQRFYGMSQERADNQFADAQERDSIKSKYCADRCIRLLVIPYWAEAEIGSLVKGFLRQLQDAVITAA